MKQQYKAFCANSNRLKFTPLEFETQNKIIEQKTKEVLKFTPLEFETVFSIRSYVWSLWLKFTPLEFETS